MEVYELNLNTDETSVFQYLQHHPEDFISEMEVARRADSRNRFMNDTHWAHVSLLQLVEKHLLETDGSGRYRVLIDRPHERLQRQPHKFIDPRLRAILERSGHNFDLSCYA